MKQEPIRVLQITGGMNMGGIENFIMNVYRNIDKDKVQFDFLIHQDEKQIFEDEIVKLGGKIYRISSIRQIGYLKYKKILRKFFEENQYKIVHSHYNELSGLILEIAKKVGIKVRIAHSHTSYPKYSNIFLNIISKYLVNKLKDDKIIKFSCSKRAGEWLFGKNSIFKIINNGINPEEYIFNLNKRDEERKKLGISKDDIILGHVGRFSNEKNHLFLIDVFNELYKKNKNYKLILIGDGPTKEEVMKKVKTFKLEKRVSFLGVRKDVKNLLQSLDLFILPSIFEGLPVTLVEAQGAGLKCFISDCVTREIDLECGLTEFISLEKSPKEWAETVDSKREYERKNTIEALRSHGYDMTENAKKFEKKYIELYNN